jgi:TolB-like protein
MNFLSRPVVILFLLAASAGGCAGAHVTGIASGIPAKKFLIAVFPIENLTGVPAPSRDLRLSLMGMLKSGGLELLDDNDLDRFMERHRVRYIGGIDKQTAVAFKKETGADAVLITSLERYDEIFPPKIALFCRLVSTEENPSILWMERTGMSGNDSPGILGLGLIGSPGVLAEKALSVIAGSLGRYLSTGHRGMNAAPHGEAYTATAGEAPPTVGHFGARFARGSRALEGRFAPKVSYRAFGLGPENRYRVAVLPFQNFSPRKNAGEIVALHFIRQLSKQANISVVEPGVVRQLMLEHRIIMPGGLSLSDVRLLGDYPPIDLVFTGTVFDYRDYTGLGGTPKVDFSVEVIGKKSEEVLWASESYNRGNDGVFFFDAGTVNTANAMASRMVGATVAEMMARQNSYTR